jgi:iron(II)-dependent oxidoreductase
MGTGGAVGTGGAMGTGGAAVGTGGRAGTGGAMGTGGAAVDACAGACGPRTFCNQARAVCLTTDPEWVPVAGGTFTMGNDAAPSPYSDFSPWGPAHQVHVPDFQMLRTEVTVAQYRACVNAGTCTLPMNPYGDSRDAYSHAGFDNHPVNNVTSSQAAAYCAFIGGRLPGEAEWEYADSNGGMGIYAWNYGGDHSGFDCNHAVIGSNGCGMNSTWEVCSKPLGNTSHGLCDMTGNVSEWTADDYSLYDANKDGIIDTPVDGSAYHSPNHTDFTSVFRVGSYIDTLAIGKIIITDLQSCFYRATLSSYPYGYNVGFRCARDATR